MSKEKPKFVQIAYSESQNSLGDHTSMLFALDNYGRVYESNWKENVGQVWLPLSPHPEIEDNE